MAGAFETGIYRNVFLECGIPEEEIEKKVSDTFRTMFYGKDEERIYHEVGPDCGFLTDTGNNDVRTEGMSYGMMMCVQMNKRRIRPYLEMGQDVYVHGRRNPGGPS